MQLADELLLLEDEPLQAARILDADAVRCQLLELCDLLAAGASRPFSRAQQGLLCPSDCLGRREPLPYGEGGGRVGILEDLGELGEQLVAVCEEKATLAR